MIHYYVYIQNWGTPMSAMTYNAYTDNEFLMMQYIKQIEYILEENHYIGKGLLESVTEFDFKSETDLLNFLSRTEDAYTMTRENKLYSVHSEFNNLTVFINHMIYIRFYDNIITCNEILKMNSDLYRISSPKMLSVISSYVNRDYSEIILDILKRIYTQHEMLRESVHISDEYLVMSTFKIWEIVDVVIELLRFMNIDIMEIFRLQSLPFY